LDIVFEGAMQWRDKIVELILNEGFKTCAEIGSWKCSLSSKILNAGVDKLYMVDPLRTDFMRFPIKNLDPFIKKGEYHSRMGERGKSQEDLDLIHRQNRKALKKYGERAKFLRMSSVHASKIISDQSLDFVFIDAIHLYESVKQDITLWLPKIVPNGILAGHDYGSDKFPGVAEAVKELLPNHTVPIKLCWAYRVL